MQDLAPFEQLGSMRAEFLSLVSRELRTPLISIRGSTPTFMSASDTPDASEMVQCFRGINEQADHRRSLISDLLDRGRIKASRLSVSPDPAEAAGLVERAKNTFLGRGRSALDNHRPSTGSARCVCEALRTRLSAGGQEADRVLRSSSRGRAVRGGRELA